MAKLPDDLPIYVCIGVYEPDLGYVVEEGAHVVSANVTVSLDNRQLTDAILKYGMIHRIQASQASGARGAFYSPKATETPAEDDQTQRHLEALREVAKTSFWWQAQKIIKEALTAASKPEGEDGLRYMIALEEAARTSCHWETVDIVSKALSAP